MIDNDYAVWGAFGNQYWPALYLVDAQGRFRHHHFGEGEYEQSERDACNACSPRPVPDIVDDTLVEVDAARC